MAFCRHWAGSATTLLARRAGLWTWQECGPGNKNSVLWFGNRRQCHAAPLRMQQHHATAACNSTMHVPTAACNSTMQRPQNRRPHATAACNGRLY
eukprot:359720-Chlamydomonas_euryale.AAC.4